MPVLTRRKTQSTEDALRAREDEIARGEAPHTIQWHISHPPEPKIEPKPEPSFQEGPEIEPPPVISAEEQRNLEVSRWLRVVFPEGDPGLVLDWAQGNVEAFQKILKESVTGEARQLEGMLFEALAPVPEAPEVPIGLAYEPIAPGMPLTAEGRIIFADEVQEAIDKVYRPGVTYEDVFQFADLETGNFIRDILTRGRTPDVDTLLRSLGLTTENIEGIFEPTLKPTELVNDSLAELGLSKREQYDKSLQEMSWWQRQWHLFLHPPPPDIKKYVKAPKLARSFMAGIGDAISSFSGVARWAGMDDVAASMSEEATAFQSLITPTDFGEFDISDVGNPEWWTEKVVRTLPFALSLAPLGIAGYFGGAAIAGAVGLGTIGAMIVGGLSGAALSRPAESALEAGAAYNEAIAEGKTEKEADDIFKQVFRENMVLAGADAWEIAIALAPTPKWVPASLVKSGLVRTARIGGKVIIVGLSEGGEEAVQDIINRRARGEEIKLDPIMKEAIAIGFVMGAGMGLGGDVITSLVKDVKPKLEGDLKTTFDTEKARFMREGSGEQLAELQALDIVARTPEGREIIFSSIEGIVPETAKIKAEARAELVPEAVPEILPLEQVSKLETRIPIDLIRKDEVAEIGRLTKEIQDEGIKEPITIRVREDGSQIVWDGIHRLIVAQDLGLENVPVKFIGEIEKLPPPAKPPSRKPPPPKKPPAPPAEAIPKAEVGEPEVPTAEVVIPEATEAQQAEYTKRIKPFLDKADIEIKKVNDDFLAGKTSLTENQVQRDAINAELDRQANIIRADMGFPVARPPAVKEVKLPVAKVVEEIVAEAPPVEEVVPEVDVEVRRQLDELQKMHDIWRNKLATSEQTKASLAKFVRENLPTNVRGKFITAVAKVKTDVQLQTQITRVQEVAELNAQKVLKTEIKKEIKRTKAVVKDKILKGKFTPDVQRRLDVITHNLDVDRDIARAKMAENIQRYEAGELSYEDMLESNDSLNFAGIDGMSAEELANALEYIKTLKIIGKLERQEKQEVATARIRAIRTDISGILTGGKGLKTGIGAVPRAGLAPKPGWLDTFVNWQYGIDNLADKLSKFDTTSQPFQSAINQFVSQVHRATNRQVIGTKEAYNKVKDEVADAFKVKGTHDVNQVLNGLDEEVNLGTFQFTSEYIEKNWTPEMIQNNPGLVTFDLKMTRDEMIAKYMQMQDPTLDNTFTTGMGWSQRVRDAIESNLTEQEKKLAGAFFDFYENYYQSVNQIYQELYNIDMPHNPQYSPIRRDFEGNVAENVLTLKDAGQYASVLNGSLKARQRNIRPLKFNAATRILSNHIEQMEHFKAWATTMRDMRRVFGSTEIRQAIEQYHGRGIVKLLDTFMNQMARGGVETAATNQVADYLRRAFTKSILAIKPVIALKQIPSLFAYVSEMNTTDFFTGIADFWKSPVANFKFLYNNSEMFKARMSVGFERDIRAAMEKHGKQAISGKGKFTDWFLLQIRAGDTFAVTQGMWAKYKAGLKQGLSQSEAIATAEDTTSRTQPSFGIDTLSAIQNAGSWLKLMTMFQNQPNKYFRIVGDNARNFKYGRGSRAKAASTIILAWVVLPMMFQYIADAFQWKPERQARAGLLGPLNFILIGGQLVQSIWGWLTDQPFDYQVSPVAQTGRDLQMIFLKAKKLYNQGIDPFKDINADDVANLVEYLAKAVGQVTGLPTPYFVQVEKGIREKLTEGEGIDIKDFLFSQWALEPPKKSAEGQIEDLNLLLGEMEEGQEDKPLTEKELKIYDTKDWLRDIGKVYKNVLPQDVIDDTSASVESKAWASYEVARSKADILPDIPLRKINTEDNDDTIINYYQQWKAREKITSLEKLREFDKLYPKANLGNVTRQQYNLLKKYLEAEDKDAFLDSHPGLNVNPRTEWLKANPVDNAYLALGGQAKILTQEAYSEFERLVKALDVPDDAIPELALPPKGSVQSHFDYIDAVDEFTAGSAEAKLVLTKDSAYLEWRTDLTEPEQPERYYELKAKNRTEREYLDTLKDKDSPETYIEDEDERREAFLKKFPETGLEYYDDERRTEAISKGFDDDQIEAWVERGRLVDKTSGSHPTVKLWAFDNPEAYARALEEKLITDKGGLATEEERGHYEQWVEPALRIQADKTFMEEGEYWDTINKKASPDFIEDEDERKETFLKKFKDSKYFENVDRIRAFKAGFTETETKLYLEKEARADESGAGSYEVLYWWLNHKEMFEKSKEAFGTETEWKDLLDREVVIRFNVDFAEEEEAYSAIEPNLINPATGVLFRTEYLQADDKFRIARRRSEGYEKGIGEGRLDQSALVDKYVAYNELPIRGYEQERFLVQPENHDLVMEMKRLNPTMVLPKAEEIPDVRYDEITKEFQVDFRKWDDYGDPEHPSFIEDSDERAEAREDLKLENGKITPFGKATIERDAYGKLIPPKYTKPQYKGDPIADYVSYYSLIAEGKPDDWPEGESWHEDDWWMQEHKGFYQEVYLNSKYWDKPHDRKDYRLTPTKKVWGLYMDYKNPDLLLVGTETFTKRSISEFRKWFRWRTYQRGETGLEDFLIEKGYTPIYEQDIPEEWGGEREERPSPEGLAEREKEITEELEKTTRRLRELARR